MDIAKKILLGLCTLSLISCDKEQSVSFREQFYQERLCPEIIYQCLPESQKNDIKETTMFDPNNPYKLSEVEWNGIKRHNTLRMYDEIAQLLDIAYPGFWQDKDAAFKRAWMEKVDSITKKFYPKSHRGALEIMALICAIIGVDFEQDPKLAFIVKHIKSSPSSIALDDIHDYLRFEVLKEDYNLAGVYYSNWSLRDVMDFMPRLTRKVPDFNKMDRVQDVSKSIYKKYLDEVYQGGRLK